MLPTIKDIIVQGKLEELKKIIAEDYDIDQPLDDNHSTVLHIAVKEYGSYRKEMYEIIEFLLEKQADPTKENSNGLNPFEIVVTHGNIKVSQLFLKYFPKASLNRLSRNGMTLLSRSIQGLLIAYYNYFCSYDYIYSLVNTKHSVIDDNKEVVESKKLFFELLQAGCSPDVKNQIYCDFILAIINSDVQTVKNLIDKVDVNLKLDYGLTPLHIVTLFRCNKEIANILLNHKKIILSRDNFGFTPLHYSVIVGNEYIFIKLVENDINSLFEEFKFFNVKTKNVFQMALHCGFDLITLLNAHISSVILTNERSALITNELLTFELPERNKLVEMLLPIGLCPNVLVTFPPEVLMVEEDVEALSLAHVAVRDRDNELLKLLLTSKDIDLTIKGTYIEAERDKCYGMYCVVEVKRFKLAAFNLAAIKRNIEALNALLNHDKNLINMPFDYELAVPDLDEHICGEENLSDFVESYESKYNNLNYYKFNNIRLAHFFAMNFHIPKADYEIINFLIQNNHDFFTEDNYGLIPFEYALAFQNTEILNILVKIIIGSDAHLHKLKEEKIIKILTYAIEIEHVQLMEKCLQQDIRLDDEICELAAESGFGKLFAKQLQPPKKKFKSRLMVGEGGFQFTKALTDKYQDVHPDLGTAITATEYLPESTLKQAYNYFENNIKLLEGHGVKIHYEVDCQSLHTDKRLANHYPRIHFNFPHDKSSFKQRTLPNLIRNFFKSAAQIQQVGDKIYMALPKPPEEGRGNRKFYQAYVYGIYDASVSAGYMLTKKRDFGPHKYPGYEHSITGNNSSAKVAGVARTYVFTKTDWPHEKIMEKNPPLKVAIYGNIYNYFKEPDTTDASSDYVEIDEKTISYQRSMAILSSQFSGLWQKGSQLPEINNFVKVFLQWESALIKKSGQSFKNFDNKLSKKVKLFGFKCHDVLRDGKCFFHAVLNQLHQNNLFMDVDVNKLIQQTVSHLIEYIASYKAFMVGGPDKYLDALSKGEAWADHVSILALSRALKVTLAIIHEDDQAPTIIKQSNEIAKIFLGYNGSHYQSLLKDPSLGATKNIEYYINTAEIDSFHLSNTSREPIEEEKDTNSVQFH